MSWKAGRTTVCEVNGGKLEVREILAGEFFDPPASLDSLKGGDAADNARILSDILGGEPGPRRDIVVLNSAAALVVARRAHDLREGILLAAGSIDSGAARRVLEEMRKIAAA